MRKQVQFYHYLGIAFTFANLSLFADPSHQYSSPRRETVIRTQRPTAQENYSHDNFGTSRVLQLAQSNINRRVGNGTCAALRGSGPTLGTVGGGGSGMEQILPGMVLRLSPGASIQGSMGRFTVSSQGHYIVVESIDPEGNITFLDQNWLGGNSAGQKVRRATASLRTLRGSASIYSGD